MLQRYVPHAAEAIMRNEQWEMDLLPFYTTNSPRFINFQSIIIRSKIASSSSSSSSSSKQQHHHNTTDRDQKVIIEDNNGIGIDLQMTLVHQEYIALIEEKMNKLFVAMNITASEFIHSMKSNLDCNDEAVNRLHTVISTYHDFIEFGSMMQKKYNELHSRTAVCDTTITDDSATTSDVRSTIDHSRKPMVASSMRICRVLWDLENIPVVQKDGMYTVGLLHRFLRSVDLMGQGVDTRITAFFNPYNKSISKKIIEQLNKSSVELVLASAKREDADRKLGMRINQDMLLLQPSHTTFVIISSDQDFRHHIQLLANNGFEVIIIHDATSSSWKTALEMHATRSYVWSSFMVPSADKSQEVDDDTDDYPVDDGDVEPSYDSVTHVTNAVLSIDGSRNRQPSIHVDNAKAKKEDSSAAVHTTTAHPDQRDSSREQQQLSVGWRVATCMRWHSAYGFLLVDTSHPPVHEHFTIAVESAASGGLVVPAEMLVEKQRNKSSSSTTVKVYVHRSALKSKPSSQKMLSNGEYVLALIQIDDKGPKAVVVKDLFSQQQVTPT